uniref:SMC_N domain-containing protein n=1 Tax=Rhabditophanes sp. KR3021 TaxID=114890 RepID=A0AC35TZD8_9BILA
MPQEKYKLREIRLRHFKSFVDETTIGPLEDVNVILGGNGAGKSNILDGIQFALLQKPAALRVKSEGQLISKLDNGSPMSTSFFVELTFAARDASIKLRRDFCTHPSKSKDANGYSIDGVTVKVGTYREAISSLGVVGNLENVAISQGLTKTVARKKPVELSSFIEQLCCVEAEIKEHERAESLLYEVEGDLAQMRAVVKSNANEKWEIRKYLLDLKRHQVIQAEHQKECVKIKHLTLFQNVQALHGKRHQLTTQQSKSEEAKRKIMLSDDNILENNRQIVDLKIEEAEEAIAIKEIQKMVNQKQAIQKKNEMEKKALATRREGLENAIVQLTKEEDSLIDKKAVLENQIQQAKENCDGVDVQIDQFEDLDSQEILKKAAFDKCQNQYDDESFFHQLKLENAREDLKRANGGIARLKTSSGKFNNELIKNETEVTAMTGKRNAIVSDLSTMTQQRDYCENELPRKVQELETFQLLLGELNGDLTKKTSEVKSLIESLANSREPQDPNVSSISDSGKDLDWYLKNMKLTTSRIKSSTESMNVLEDEIKQLEKTIQSVESKEARHENVLIYINEKLDLLNEISTSLRESLSEVDLKLEKAKATVIESERIIEVEENELEQIRIRCFSELEEENKNPIQTREDLFVAKTKILGHIDGLTKQIETIEEALDIKRAMKVGKTEDMEKLTSAENCGETVDDDSFGELLETLSEKEEDLKAIKKQIKLLKENSSVLMEARILLTSQIQECDLALVKEVKLCEKVVLQSMNESFFKEADDVLDFNKSFLIQTFGNRFEYKVSKLLEDSEKKCDEFQSEMDGFVFIESQEEEMLKKQEELNLLEERVKQASLIRKERKLTFENLESKRTANFKAIMENLNKALKVLTNLIFGSNNSQALLVNSSFQGSNYNSSTIFNFWIYGKQLQQIEDMSGGEQNFASLILLVACCLNFPGPFLFLDEVDACLDGERRALMTKIIEQLSGGTTIMVITHNRDIAGCGDKVIAVMDEIKDGSHRSKTFGMNLSNIPSVREMAENDSDEMEE